MKVSVAMATHNGEAFLKQQIDSIINQLNEEDELIISDDNSADATIHIIQSYNDNRIKLFQNNKSLGVIKNFEKALEKTTGEIIFLSDQDDVWLPNKVETCIKFLQQYDIVVTDCIVTNDQLKPISNSYFETQHSEKGILHNLKRNTYLGCCMAFKKKLLDIALPFPNKIPMHDIWLGFISDLFFKPLFLKEKFVLYRRHIHNASFTAHGSQYNFIQKIAFRVNTILYLPLLYSRYKKIRSAE